MRYREGGDIDMSTCRTAAAGGGGFGGLDGGGGRGASPSAAAGWVWSASWSSC